MSEAAVQSLSQFLQRHRTYSVTALTPIRAKSGHRGRDHYQPCISPQRSPDGRFPIELLLEGRAILLDLLEVKLSFAVRSRSRSENGKDWQRVSRHWALPLNSFKSNTGDHLMGIFSLGKFLSNLNVALTRCQDSSVYYTVSPLSWSWQASTAAHDQWLA